MKIAILDDDQPHLQSMESLLTEAGFDVVAFSAGRQLIRSVREQRFDMFVLDWNLPDVSGLSVLEWIRNQIGTTPPVLLVTSRVADEDVVMALNAGADDFISKPFKSEIFLARVRALSRRCQPNGTERATEAYGRFEFDLAARKVRSNGDLIDITPKEFQLALLLFRNVNIAVARAHMLETIWGMAPTADTRTPDIHVSKVRKKMGLGPETGYTLSTVYGYGYRLEELSNP